MDPLLLAITDFVNAMLQGGIPDGVHPCIFGGSLTALAKSGGGCAL